MTDLNMEVIRFGLAGGGLFFFLILEFLIPSYEKSVSKFRRWLNNFALAIINFSFFEGIIASLLVITAQHATERQIGISNLVNMPHYLKIIDALILMDFLYYVVHILMHRIPFFWRFHRVHHTDLDVDVSTAFRFHIGEIGFRAIAGIGGVYFIGADPTGVFLFEGIFLIAFLFQHSGIRLPVAFENAIWILFVPPAMHRTHHSVDFEERNTNFGGILSIWDRMLGTLLTGVNLNKFWTGVDGHIQEKKLEFYHLLWLPFTAKVR